MIQVVPPAMSVSSKSENRMSCRSARGAVAHGDISADKNAEEDEITHQKNPEAKIHGFGARMSLAMRHAEIKAGMKVFNFHRTTPTMPIAVGLAISMSS